MDAFFTATGTLSFFDHNTLAGKLIYPRRFSSYAEIVCTTGEVYKIESGGFWKSRYEVSKGGKVIVSLRKKWTGVAVLNAFHPMQPAVYTFRQKGLFNIRYVLTDKDLREMVVVRSRFILKGFRTVFELEINDSLRRREGYFILSVITTWLTRMAMRQYSAGVVATG